MRKKIKKTALILSLFIGFTTLLLLSSCTRENRDGDWHAVTKKEGTVTTITNPQDPKYGEITFDLVQDLNIGSEDDENYLFYRVAGINVDGKENIYALDAGNCRVQKFDKDGKYLQTIGRKGQGPGEFANPWAFFIGADNTLYVSDQMKIEVFDAAGEHKKSIPLETRIYDFFVTPDDQIITYTILSEDGGNKKAIIKLDTEGKTIATVAEFTDVRAVQSNTAGRGTMTFKAYHQYNYWPYLCPSDSDGFEYAYPIEYKLFKMKSDGELSLVIEKDVAPNLISSEEKKFIKDNIRGLTEKRGIQISDEVLETACQFPPHRPFFNRILLDNAGRTYVRNARSVLDRNAGTQMDIFSRDGYYLYRASFPFAPDLIHAGYVYDVFTSDETGTVEIKRYRVKNWDQMEK